MATREFTDERGTLWRAWEVRPETLERRIASDPLLRPAVERRRQVESRIKVSNPQMAGGWLAFESRGERRRLAPIPDHWDESTDRELCALLAQAEVSGHPRRLIE